ncbi:fimbrial protein [Pantoea sp. SOD02]|uniref:fimbrial protein n=1 Tax=Pantoea sp. SOD02 TaxID=2970818 RepID=UPI0021589E07|nr:fimbrial protein [Pantoea sp. SOD02]UVC29810.1 fimbrial protein [Pantoea sp. SOD02]
MKYKIQTVLLILSALIMHRSAYSVENLLFKGSLIDMAECTINNDQRIDIDFGPRLGISQIDGVNYRQAINYQINCLPGTTTPDMAINITANAMTNDNTAIQTDKTGLGIRLLQNGMPMNLNQALVFTSGNPPVLEAVPVTSDANLLTEGAFLAVATIQVEYQ